MDSYGIAVADAINYGAIVIASDVCERYHGCRTYSHTKKCDFFAALDSAIDELECRVGGRIPTKAQILSDEASAFNNLYFGN
jgi:hypothetical protein